LHSLHIAEASDEKMNQIGAQMETEENEASKSLDELAPGKQRSSSTIHTILVSRKHATGILFHKTTIVKDVPIFSNKPKIFC